MDEVEPIELLYSLIGYPSETEWIEFKEGNADPERIGWDISALANSAAFHGRDLAYRIWGVEDGSRRLVGTSFNHNEARGKGNQLLPIWLKHTISANASYEFSEFDRDGLHFVVLTIHAAVGQPVCFNKEAYIREGSSTTRLEPGSAKEAELWRRLQRADFETLVARKDVTDEGVLELLDVSAFYAGLGISQPTGPESLLYALREQDLVRPQDNGRWSVTNLGALLLARNLRDFACLRKRAVRVIVYQGKGNIDIRADHEFAEGYVMSLPKALDYILDQTSEGEEDQGAYRRRVHAYPQRAVREMLNNTVIHQDLSATDAGPLVQIYDNRIEFSNPGASLIPVERVLNAPSKTRNTDLVRILRQMGLCEEGGTGWDRAVESCEQARTFSPRMRSEEDMGTVVTLFRGDAAFEHMTRQERVDALYWHTCLMYAQREAMSNQSLRERFGLGDERKDVLAVSRLIRSCCDDGLIKVLDDDSGPRFRRYIPGWA